MNLEKKKNSLGQLVWIQFQYLIRNHLHYYPHWNCLCRLLRHLLHCHHLIQSLILNRIKRAYKPGTVQPKVAITKSMIYTIFRRWIGIWIKWLVLWLFLRRDGHQWWRWQWFRHISGCRVWGNLRKIRYIMISGRSHVNIMSQWAHLIVFSVYNQKYIIRYLQPINLFNQKVDNNKKYYL